MEFVTVNAHNMHATRSRLATALRDLKCVLPRATVAVGTNTLSLETGLPEPAVTMS